MNLHIFKINNKSNTPLNNKFKDLILNLSVNSMWLFAIMQFFFFFCAFENIIPTYGFLLICLLIVSLIEVLILSFISKVFYKNWLKEIFLTHAIIILLLFFDFCYQAYQSNGTMVILTNLWTWFDFAPEFIIDFKLQQSVLFLLGTFLIAIAGICILVFSVNYISNFELIKFVSFILLFIITMLFNVLANDWLLMFMGWEGIGLMSFLLINFWKFRHEANKSALKAFFVNKIGDIMIILICVLNFSTYKNSVFLGQIIYFLNPDKSQLHFFFILLLFGILGKSAQFFFHFWLDDAMEGPTPVSALIHAATLVTAGSFLIFKNQTLFTQAYFINIFLVIGLFSALSGIFASFEQDDLKKAVAYTTLTNIGLVFSFCGLGLLNLGFFHLVTHGFYKAFVFLAVGNYIHLTGGEQSIIFKGISGKKMLLDYFFLVLSSMLMIGFPFLGAFYSKEPLFNLNLITINGVFIILLSTIFFLGVISNFSIVSSLFVGTPSRSAKIVLEGFHRPVTYFDFILLILGAISIVIPILIYNIIVIDRTSLISSDFNTLMNHESSIILLNFSELNFNFIQLGILLLSISLMYFSGEQQYFLSKIFPNISLGDKIILSFVNLAGILNSKISKLAANIFWLNEYILLEFIFFQNGKHLYTKCFVNFFNKLITVSVLTQFICLLIVYAFCFTIFLF